VVNWSTGAAPPYALAIATGNTLEAVLAAYVLARFIGFRCSLDRLRDALGFVIVGAGLSTVVSATIGVAALWAGGMVATGTLATTWRAWYVGDALGDLVFGSLFLAWGAKRPTAEGGQRTILRVGEAVILGFALVIVSWFIFFERGSPAPPYLLFPLLTWAAVRFEARGATLATMLISLVAVWATSLRLGPFVRATPQQSLLALHVFMAVTALTALIFAALVAERWRSEVLRRREELLEMVSHDLKTPLSAIEMATGLLDNHLAPNERVGGAGRQLATIRRSAQRMGALIHDLLELAAAEAGNIALHAGRHDAREILAEAIDMMQPLASQRTSTLSLQCPEQRLMVICDRERILEVLSNLIGNAIKFAPEGGTVCVSARPSDSEAVFSVADTGPGIPPDQLCRIFDRFWQARSSSGGTGLGLAIAKRLLAAHGSKISVVSRTGLGSRFFFSLRRC
jgi:signal transduction histidine kinase